MHWLCGLEDKPNNDVVVGIREFFHISSHLLTYFPPPHIFIRANSNFLYNFCNILFIFEFLGVPSVP
jgi:hypothetical protein